MEFKNQDKYRISSIKDIYHTDKSAIINVENKGNILSEIKGNYLLNSPELWRHLMPKPTASNHKYNRGYAMITGGKDVIGATKLAARAAQRIGAGIVVIASPEKSAPLYRLGLESVVVKSFRDTAYYNDIINDEKIGACLIGPGLGRDFSAQEKVLTTLRVGHKTILDADALSMFEGHEDLLFDTIDDGVILTPHEGEFAKIFPDLEKLDKILKVKEAAKRSGAIIILKGSDSVIANPDGDVVINNNAPPTLATAGSGDVLAGIIVGLVSQNCDQFTACAIACWIHGEAANVFGQGLIAEDIIEKIPQILNSEF